MTPIYRALRNAIDVHRHGSECLVKGVDYCVQGQGDSRG